MGQMRPLNVQVERHVLRWRTYRGRATAETYLSLVLAPQHEQLRQCMLQPPSTHRVVPVM
ncbi:Uncharacterised protein [Mycobacterium tuberculosis]|nr:Uncharacterised protein [Mycobacterium tuberculosis]